MKKQIVLCSALFALTASAELWAQARPTGSRPSSSGSSSSGSSRPSSSGSSSSGSSHPSSSGSSSAPRGPSYNPGGSSSSSSSRPSSSSPSSSSSSRPSSSSSSSSSSSPRGPSYNPGGSSSSSSSSSRPSSSSSSSSSPSSSGSSSTGSSSTPRGPSYNPGGSSSSSSSSSRPSGSSSTSSSSTPRGPSYNPNQGSSLPGPIDHAPRGPHYNPSAPTPMPHTPVHEAGHVIVRRTYSHSPYMPPFRTVIFANPHAYYASVHRTYIYRRWVQLPVIFTYTDGYWDIDGYPWYVHSGYRYRYNPVELCKYELVDGDSYQTIKAYGEVSCNTAYDQCAVERDEMNRQINMERYFCAEAVDKDQEVAATEVQSIPSPIDLDAAKLAAIKTYLDTHGMIDIFDEGREGGVGNCMVYKLRGNEDGCNFIVTVGDEYFPDTEGGICSASKTAAQIGCDIGSEEENTGCIMAKAIAEGYCQ